DRARRAGLLAHEARLALEDARLRLEQEGDQPARSLRQITLLVRIFPRHRTRMHEVLERSEHSREDSSHPLAPTLSARPKPSLRAGVPPAWGPAPRRAGSLGRAASGPCCGRARLLLCITDLRPRARCRSIPGSRSRRPPVFL